ncbi:unnamed protein product [Symbiodinium necroappetens]|uniref:Uncharacterized protein n=1 Tax=Symbiodinium necroappetens TaxID=1628268 RepID=A0A812UTE8_9DINO|nr:unnamed protein product [Symbiodinium necroappetens]
MSGCVGGSQQAYVSCLEDCTCLATTAYAQYCSAAFAMNVTAHEMCLCWTTRCVVRCVEQAACRMGANYSGECAALEQQMRCSLDCPGGSSGLSSREWPCVSELAPASGPAGPGGVLVEPGSDLPWIVATLVGSAVVLVVLAAICVCTCRHTSKRGREAMEAEMYGRA